MAQEDYESRMDTALGDIAGGLRFNQDLAKLFQSTRVNNEEQWKFSILYGLNKGKLRSKTLDYVMFAYCGLANSRKGESRKEQIDLVKAAHPSGPKGIIGRIKETFDLE